MKRHALPYPIVLTCILLSGCAVHTDLTYPSSQANTIDSNTSVEKHQKPCLSMTYVPNGYTIEEDTYFYSSRHEFRPMEQSTLRYSYIRHKDRKLILATPDVLSQIREINPNIPDITVQTQYRDDLCQDIVHDKIYLQELIDTKADVNAKYSDGETPIHFAAIEGYADIVKALIDAGADINAKDDTGKTPIYFASKNGYADVVKVLIDAKADVNAKDNDGGAPIYFAAKEGYDDIVKALIHAGADVNVKDNTDQTPMHFAVKKGDVDLVMALINAKADVNAKDNTGGTPIYFAVKKGDADIVKALIHARAAVNVKNNTGESPMHLAVKKGNVAIVKALIDAGADVNAKDNTGGTPMHLAANIGRADIIQTLIKAKAYVNAKNNDGWTPLHYAASENHEAAVKTLVDARADIYAKNNQGWTPYMLTIKECHITDWKMMENHNDYLLTGVSWQTDFYVLPGQCIVFKAELEQAQSKAALDGVISSYYQRELSVELIKCWKGSFYYIHQGNKKLEEVAKKCEGKWF